MKLLGQLGLATFLVPFAFASPVTAQVTVNNNSSELTNRLGPSYGPTSPNPNASIAPGGAIFPEGLSSGVSYSTTPIVREDGSDATRSGIVGSVAVDDNVSLGLGLFSVNGARTKDRHFTRSRPMEDVFARDKTVAAVGLSVRF
ncbi:MAG TPA: hypothetical protein VFO32_09095 [Sphingomicrobium sp.]|nr:hypothetical protein [Sphingomicrobium sp.]